MHGESREHEIGGAVEIAESALTRASAVSQPARREERNTRCRAKTKGLAPLIG
jgi:hypothetical protein